MYKYSLNNALHSAIFIQVASHHKAASRVDLCTVNETTSHACTNIFLTFLYMSTGMWSGARLWLACPRPIFHHPMN